MSEITDVKFKPDAEPEVNELPHRFRIPTCDDCRWADEKGSTPLGEQS